MKKQWFNNSAEEKLLFPQTILIGFTAGIRQFQEWELRAQGSKKFYNAAIYTQTDLDVRKRKAAETAQFNYEVIYT